MIIPFRLLQTKNRVAALEASIARDQAAIEALEAKQKALSSSRQESSDREGKLAQWERLKAQREELNKQVASLADCDPELMKKLKKDVGVAKACADRWTDNTWTMKGYMVKKWGTDPKEAQKMLGINDGFDYPA
jgi:hypothetical protein